MVEGEVPAPATAVPSVDPPSAAGTLLPEESMARQRCYKQLALYGTVMSIEMGEVSEEEKESRCVRSNTENRCRRGRGKTTLGRLRITAHDQVQAWQYDMRLIKKSRFYRLMDRLIDFLSINRSINRTPL